MRCDQCRFWVGIGLQEDEYSGFCHRFPAQMDGASGQEIGLAPQWGMWPITGSDNWCGEFQASKPPEPQMETHISELCLRARTRQVLRYRGINTIEQVCRLTAEDLLDLRNFGESSLIEVETKLFQRGLVLKGRPPCSPTT